MKNGKIVSLIIFLLVITGINAQTIRVDTSRHDQGTNEVIVFSRDASLSKKVSKSEKAENIVKMGQIYFVSGVIPFYYERRLLPWLTVQAGVGLTTRDFVADGINAIFVNEPEYSPYYQYVERKSLVGYYLSIQPKFYVRKEALEGFWLSPMLEFKRYNYKANEVDIFSNGDPTYLPNTFMPEHRNAVDFTLNLGWQWMFNPLSLEFTMGAGFRKFWEQRIDIEPDNNASNGQQYINGVYNYSNFRPELNFDLNFGGFF